MVDERLFFCTKIAFLFFLRRVGLAGSPSAVSSPPAGLDSFLFFP